MFFLFGQNSTEKQQMRIQEGHFLKIALNLVLTLSDYGECRTFFDSPQNYWFRCFLRRVMVIFRQQKNFGPNVIYSFLGTLYRLYIVQSDPLRCWWGIPLRLLVGESLTVGDPLRCWWRNPLRKKSENLIPIPRCQQSCFFIWRLIKSLIMK